MQLVSASMHMFESKSGSLIEYVRLIHESSKTILGQSLLPHRVSPAVLALAKAGNRANYLSPPA
jgi:hypothetical protein